MQYNELELILDGTHYVFVTRGRSKPFTAEEAARYLEQRSTDNPTAGSTLESFLEEEDIHIPEWKLPDTKQARAMFYNDLKCGLEFVKNKYGANEADIKLQAEDLGYGGLLNG